MIVSLYHRLRGMMLAIASQFKDHDTSPLLLSMQALMNQYSEMGALGNWRPQFTEEPLENAFLLLPLLVFCHEDPQDLGDRLGEFDLPQEHCAVVLDLAGALSACFREKLTPGNFHTHIARYSPVGALLQSHWTSGQTWVSLGRVIRAGNPPRATQQRLLIYGAIAYGDGRWSESFALVRSESSIISLWVAIFIGVLRGDRHLPLCLRLHHDLEAMETQVLRFWSRWSGLPPENQLQLEQVPLIASQSVLQYRPQLQLISQRHLV
ncbi:hypothetical protein [Picosynechococcus sp. PCC 8807]|uniref:hypothetical protein n=1 Tax=Picosynechococcus sp. PCC 8807 TaxID=195248 RepID=UPI0008106FD2|nr:hypothetical protein [Picosynechococcus sp. PCC 8807]ANV91345.1 hypothetical protein AWQ24_12275 [Picosynechococcus sp. PCC 8807]